MHFTNSCVLAHDLNNWSIYRPSGQFFFSSPHGLELHFIRHLVNLLIGSHWSDGPLHLTPNNVT